MESYSYLNINLLIIEDNLDERDIFEDFFRMDKNINLCGIAKDGLEGIKKAKTCNPDIVLTDFLMPNLDGAEVVRNIKNISNGQIKIIVISGVSNSKIADEILSIGADYYIIKPTELSFLRNKIISIYQKSLIDNSLICNSQMLSQNGENKAYVNEFIKELGIPLNCSGYNYIVESINIMLANLKGMTLKEIYYIIAKNNSTSVGSVENCTHNVIKKAHKIYNPVYKSLFGNSYKKCPSNSIFLNTVKENFYIMSCNK